MAKKKASNKPLRRKKPARVHVIDKHTTRREFQDARADLVGFLTKRY